MDLMKIDLDKQVTTVQKNIIRGLMKALIKRIPEAKRLDVDEAENDDEKDDEEDEVETVVKRRKYKGKNYLVDDDGFVYDNETEEMLDDLHYNLKTNKFREGARYGYRPKSFTTTVGKSELKFIRIEDDEDDEYPLLNDAPNNLYISEDNLEVELNGTTLKYAGIFVNKIFNLIGVLALDDDEDGWVYIDANDYPLLAQFFGIKGTKKIQKLLLNQKEEKQEKIKIVQEEETDTGVVSFPYDKKIGVGIDNLALYDKAKEIVYQQYPKHSAYRSGQLVKKYKEMGGTYSGKKPKSGLTRWFKEEWKDIGNEEYPVYRPTKKVSKDTPLTPDEIKPFNLKKQIALKQEIKGDANLPPFQGGKLKGMSNEVEKRKEVMEYSDPKKALENAIKYLKKDIVFSLSTKPKKKYMVMNPDTMKWTHFGEIGYEDFLKHQDPIRQNNYLKRTANMKGNWKNDKYSANNLAREILWR